MLQKNRGFFYRFRFACEGIGAAFHSEHSFRTQTVLGAGALLLLIVLRPTPVWWAILTMTIALVLAAELFNTALEAVVDLCHPETHPLVKKAKDCAAGAVLVLSIASLGVLAAFLWQWVR